MILFICSFIWLVNSAIVEKENLKNGKLPFPLFESPSYTKDPRPSFGRDMKKSMFTLKLESRDLNHGSYGSPSKPIQESYHYYFEEIQKNPEIFYRYNTANYFNEVIKELSNFVNSDTSDIVLIENASSGVNAVLRSFKKWTKNDGIIYITNEYPMTRNVIYWIAHQYGVSLFCVDIDLPIKSKKELLERVEKVLEDNKGKITFAVFDAISSTPVFILPIKELTELCHKYDIPVLVDGAHVVGQIELNFKELKPDFYLSNVHKWMLGVQGSAFLYVDKKYQDIIFPSIIGVNNNTFLNRFKWVGTRDWGSWMAIIEAIKFRKWLTNEKVHKYNNDLCKHVTETFSHDWNVSLPVPMNMVASLTNVEIPCNIDPDKGCYSWSIGELNEKLMNDEIFTVIFTFKDRRYLRISCQIYNYLEEYIELKNKIEEYV